MLDEGIAREVVNRVQRLRKKAQLQPSDVVTVQYTIEPASHDLSRVINDHRDYIESATKNRMTSQEPGGQVLVSEKYELKGAQMSLQIWKGAASNNGPEVCLKSYGKPQVPFINVVYGDQSGVILLENPLGAHQLSSWSQVADEVSTLFGKGVVKRLFFDPGCTTAVSGNVSDSSGSTVFVTPVALRSEAAGACCPFVDVHFGQKKAAFLLQNPHSSHLTQDSQKALNAVFGQKVNTLNGATLDKVQWEKLAGKKISAA